MEIIKQKTGDDLFEIAAQWLEESPDHRVLRRLQPLQKGDRFNEPPPGVKLRIGLFVDVETTGTDASYDKVIQLGAVKFSFDDQGNIYEILDTFEEYEDPGIPIPKEASDVNGIYDADVKGKQIYPESLIKLLEKVDLIIAYKADFDRKIIERWVDETPGLEFWFGSGFKEAPWACSLKEIPWEKEFGSIGAKLGNVLVVCGKFCDDLHGALMDCCAGVTALATAMNEGRSAFSCLLQSSQKTTYLLPAYKVPYTKSLIRRGYERPEESKTLWVEKEESKIFDELEWLKKNNVCSSLPQEGFPEITALERYSIRAEELGSEFLDSLAPLRMQWQEGENNIQILSEAVTGYEEYDKESGRYLLYRTQDKPGSLKEFMGYLIWDYADSRVKHVRFSQKRLLPTIRTLSQEFSQKGMLGVHLIIRSTGVGFNYPTHEIEKHNHEPLTQEQKDALSFTLSRHNLDSIVFGEGNS